MPNWAQQIVQVVGRPAWTDARVVDQHKWQVGPIQRLGFRIMPISKPFEFDFALNTMMEWHIHHDRHSRFDRVAIQSAVVTIDGGGRVRIYEGHFNGDKSVVRCPAAFLVDSQQLFLVIANAKVGPGRSNHALDPISSDLVIADSF